MDGIIEKPLLKDSDSRLKGYFGGITTPDGKHERVFCFLCGHPAGWVSKESSNLIAPVHMLASCEDCDRGIIAKYGGLPLEQVPVWLRDAMGYIPEKRGT